MLGYIGQLDHTAVEALNAIVDQEIIVNDALYFIITNELLKGGFAMILFWSAWFWPRADLREAREKLAAVLVVACVAILVGRLLANFLPFRLRPMHDETVKVNSALDAILDGWSSFPSDHAVLFFSFAIGLLLVHRVIGIIALAHAVLVISLPRVVLGLHYPSDLFAGALVGGALSFGIVPALARLTVWRRTIAVAEAHAWLLYPTLFALTFQAATLFNAARNVIRFFVKVISYILMGY